MVLKDKINFNLKNHEKQSCGKIKDYNRFRIDYSDKNYDTLN